jgi:glycosyltransferase involved in cell wall biosynthesis
VALTSSRWEPAAGAARRVHLVYPHGERISTPDAIGRQLGLRLENRYEVIYHDWSDRGAIVPEPGDVLVGHPHPHPNTVFRRSLRHKGWHRRLMLAPFHHGDLRQIAFEDPIVRDCDLILAITGPYWFRSIETSRCSHWQPKMVHVDLAIDRRDFPPLQTAFRAKGERRVLYIGHTGRGKNTSYLSEIAAHIPDTEFGWIGKGERPIERFKALGAIDFGSQTGRNLVSQFDFLLTVGKADANPTTILEAMAWGLVPICTPTSGYDGIASIPNVPLHDAEGAAAVVRRLLGSDESDLLAMQSENWRLLDEHYSWDRFASQVTAAIESSDSPSLRPESSARRLVFAFYDVTSPYGRVAYGLPGRLVARCRWQWQKLRAAWTAQTRPKHRRG